MTAAPSSGGAVAAPEHVVEPYAHGGPWTEAEWLALPDRRVGLVDGALVMSPGPANRHQRLALRIAARLDAAAPDGWEVLPAPNVRLATDRDLIPDIAILTDADMDTAVNDATDVVLVVEIVSPGNASYDRIRHDLRVQPREVTLDLAEPSHEELEGSGRRGRLTYRTR